MVPVVLRVRLADLWHQVCQLPRLWRLVSSSRRGGELLVRSLLLPVLLLAVAMACSMTGEEPAQNMCLSFGNYYSGLM